MLCLKYAISQYFAAHSVLLSQWTTSFLLDSSYSLMTHPGEGVWDGK